MTTLTSRIVAKMTPHVHSEAEQRALLACALEGFDSVRSTVPIEGTAAIFSTRCTTKLLKYGRLADGTHPLSRVLASLRDSLQPDPEWDELITGVESWHGGSADEELADLTAHGIRFTLIEHFSLAELHNLAVELGVDHDEIAGETKSEYAREFVTYFENRERLRDVVEALRSARRGAL